MELGKCYRRQGGPWNFQLRFERKMPVASWGTMALCDYGAQTPSPSRGRISGEGDCVPIPPAPHLSRKQRPLSNQMLIKQSGWE